MQRTHHQAAPEQCRELHPRRHGRNASIPVRHGINGHAHPLASLGAPGTFPPAVWNAFTRPNAEQRIRRLLAIPGQPGLHHAARELGIRHAILASQIRQLEAVTGTTLLRTGPDGMITLTAHGEQFARDVRPVLESIARSRENTQVTHRDQDGGELAAL